MISALLITSVDDHSTFVVDGGLRVTRARHLGDAIRLLETSTAPPPELVVLAESRGGSFGEASLHALRKLAPLARIWRVLGTWCEGETRSGRPPAACLAAYWHQWEARLSRELEWARRGANPTWTLPLTATADERLLAAADEWFARRRAGTIVICAASARAAAALADLCLAAGYNTLVAAEDARFHIAGAAAVLWDTTVGRMADATAVGELQSRAGGAPLLAIVGFPRFDDVELARRAGIAAVISKPFLAGDLLWHLDRVAATSRHAGSSPG
jgi:CheY-like chemotaxis protein